MKPIYLILLSAFIASSGFSDNEINMANGVSVTSCEGTVYDHAGPNGNITSHNRYLEFVINASEPNKAVQLVFRELRFGYSGAFNLKVYNGQLAEDDLLVEFTNGWDNSPWIDVGIQANSGTVTLVFTSASIWPASESVDGFKAEWNCVDKSYNMDNAVVTACAGAIHDPGGPAGKSTDNQDYIFIIHAESSGKGIALEIPFANLWLSELNIYDGPNVNAPLVWSGTGLGAGSGPIITQSGSLTVELLMSGSTGPNFLAVWQCFDLEGTQISNAITSECSGTLYDSGGLNGNYLNNEDHVFHITTQEPNHVIELRLLDLAVEYGIDTLWLYDGPTVSAGSLIGYGSGFLGQSFYAQSSGNTVTVRFKSNGTGTNTGWLLNWNCKDTLGVWNVSTGVYDQTPKETSINVFPNPTSSDISIAGWSSDQSHSTLKVIGMDGRVLNERTIPIDQYHNFLVDLSGLIPGHYQLTIQDEDRIAHKRIIKQ